jgi:hypothetical protein
VLLGLQIETWDQLTKVDYELMIRPVLEHAGVLTGIIEALKVALAPPTGGEPGHSFLRFTYKSSWLFSQYFTRQKR